MPSRHVRESDASERHHPSSLPGQSGATTVACLGSSSTAGKGQAFDWIRELSRRPRNRGTWHSRLMIVSGTDVVQNILPTMPATEGSESRDRNMMLG
jgi:hypothetical protein